MESLNNGGTASLPLTPALQHPRHQALRRGLVVVPDGFSTPLALSVDEVVSLTSFHTCRESSLRAASRRASLVTNASLATCNSDQTAVFSCHSSRAGSIDRGYHDVEDYDDDGNRHYDEGRFGVREDYAGDGYWSPAPPTAPAENHHDLERNSSSKASTVLSSGGGSVTSRWRERVGGRTNLPSPTEMLRWMRSRAQREDEDAELRQRDGKSDQSEDRRSRRILFSLALLGVFLFTISDTCLHASNHFAKAGGGGGARSGEQDRWVAVFLRSIVQLVVSASIAAGTKNFPWGPVRAWPRLLVVAILTGFVVFAMDFSYRFSTDRFSSFLCYMLLPLATFVATTSMALFFKCASSRTGEWKEREGFAVHRIISILCLASAAFLFTQPQLIHLASEAPPAKPYFVLDTAFSWPLDVLGYGDSATDSHLSVGAILAHLAVPVLLAFLYVFVFICKDVHLSVVASWMSVGGGAAAIYGLFSSGAFHDYVFPTDPSYIALLSLSALFGTLGTLALVRLTQATHPNRTVLLRSLQVVLVYVLQLCFGTKSLHLYDVFAAGLVLVSALHVTMELVFF